MTDETKALVAAQLTVAAVWHRKPMGSSSDLHNQIAPVLASPTDADTVDRVMSLYRAFLATLDGDPQ